jgi:hypothetical protein
MKLTDKEERILKTYFKVISHDPLQWAPITNEKLKLSPLSVKPLIELISKVIDDTEEEMMRLSE